MRFTRAIVVVIVFFGCWAPFREAFGRDGGLDVVLTIDTSGSMKKTDPNNLRIEACKLFLSLLEAGNRVALVTFDTFPETLSPMTPLGASRDEWVRRLERVSSNGPYTDLYKAIYHASEVLSESTRTKRAIVLMTDGRMDVGDPSSEKELSSRLFDTLIPEMERQGIQIYTVAFTKESDFDFLKRAALESGGFFYLAEKDTDLHVTFTNIYDRLIAPDTIPVQGDEFYVDRSVREITVVVSKADPETDVILVDPDRRQRTAQEHPTDVQWYQSQAFEMITVAKPLPGPWRIRYGAEQGNKVFILTDLRLRTRFTESMIPIETPTTIEAWLEQGPDTEERSPLRVQDLRVTGEVEEIDGVKAPLGFNDDGTNGDKEAADGIFTGVLTATRHGEHRLWITAHGMTFERQREHRFYVPEKEIIQAGGLQAGKVGEEEEPPAEGEREKENKASVNEETQGTSWAWVFVKFSVVNFVLLTAGSAFVLKRKGRLKFKKKTHDH